MNRELIQDYLRRAEMNDAQAEALSRIFAEMATKSDLVVFQEQVDRRLRLLEEQMAHLRTELTAEMTRQIAGQTRWMIAVIVLFGTVVTILNAIMG